MVLQQAWASPLLFESEPIYTSKGPDHNRFKIFILSFIIFTLPYKKQFMPLVSDIFEDNSN